MQKNDWDDLFLMDEQLIEPEVTKPSRAKKRKWREIESVKEKHRLRRELEEYNEYRC